MTESSFRSALLTSFVSLVDSSSSIFMFASRRSSWSAMSLSRASTTRGSCRHGSRSSSFLRASATRLLFSSFLASSAACFSFRFLSNSSLAASPSLSAASASFLSFSSCASFSSRSFCSASPRDSSKPASSVEPARHCLAAFSHVFLASSFTAAVTAFTAASSRFHAAFAFSRVSVVRSSAATSGCQACRNSTCASSVVAATADSRQKS
mmetsp:Transcript_88254/g.250107  ORF Transcript_88254/g.250107 Transcript_88254/m.250107 type:complete len:209 (-) Transcript_88254:1162-1788(-)